MEKLIKLLNEYEDDEWETPHTRSLKDGHIKHCNSFSTYFCDLFDAFIISKQYGFIKWLVENDKIKKNYKEGLPAITKNGFLLEGETALLMILAIADNPIQDLISLLKNV